MVTTRFSPQDHRLGSLKPAEYHSFGHALKSANESKQSRLRIAILSGFSFSFLDSFLVVEASREGFALSTWFGPFGQIEQPLIDASGALWDHEPELLLIALRVEDTKPGVFFHNYGNDQCGVLEIARECIDRIRTSIELFRQRSDATVLVANFSIPYNDMRSRLFDANSVDGHAHEIARANRELALAVEDMPGVAIWDYAGLVNSRGASEWTDLRLWYLAKQPISVKNQPFAASHLMRTVRAMLTPRAKCLVLDLDNTIWGGVVGDDGISGIQIGDDHPGSIFKAFQRAILGLIDQGVLLAVVSKNELSVARQVFENHPDMLIKWEDLSAVRINWSSKSTNLIEIATELNIGLDAMVFFDDNPVEREEVRINVPDVVVIDVPQSPLGYHDALFSSGYFESLNATREDANRSKFYRDEVNRAQSKNSARTMDEFLVGLEMKVQFGCLSAETIGRVSQLLEKTNQFNLTTRRHTQARLQKMADSTNHEIRWVRLADRFGDAGLIGVSIVQFENLTATIDSLIMSCRVMNRQIELAIINDVVERAIQKKCTTIVGEFIPTGRNSVVADLYPDFGFVASEHQSGESQFFERDLTITMPNLSWPDSIQKIPS